jgi:SAM-dependent methyltransferase
MARVRTRSARSGLQWDAEDYERGRPGYPSELIERLAVELPLGRGTKVCDIAAGTGKLTRALQATGAEVVAVEPAAAMRDVLASACPGVEVLDGSAEALPVPDGSFDAVTVGQAFHWFDTRASLTEIHRILRPGGALALMWNLRDEREDWVHELGAVIRRHSGGKPEWAKQRRAWDAVIDEVGGFTDVRSARFRNVVTHDAETLVARVASLSHVAALPRWRRARCLRAVRALVARHPDLARHHRFELPHELVAYWCHVR